MSASRLGLSEPVAGGTDGVVTAVPTVQRRKKAPALSDEETAHKARLVIIDTPSVSVDAELVSQTHQEPRGVSASPCPCRTLHNLPPPSPQTHGSSVLFCIPPLSTFYF